MIASSILITGGSGYLAHGLVRRLLAEGEKRICLYSRNEHTQARMRETFRDDERLRFFIGDVRDLERLERAMIGVDTVIHAAALKRIEVGHYNPDEMTKTNVLGTMNVIEAARLAHVEKVVLVSSDKAYQPVSPYGLSKALAESLCLSANAMTLGPKFAVVRYGNVAGSTGSVIPIWRALLAAGKDDLPVSDPDATRFWMTIEQAVELVLSTAREMIGGEINVPILPAFRLGDLAQAMGGRMLIRGLGEYEKKHECMGPNNCSDSARRLTVDELRELLRTL